MGSIVSSVILGEKKKKKKPKKQKAKALRAMIFQNRGI